MEFNPSKCDAITLKSRPVKAKYNLHSTTLETHFCQVPWCPHQQQTHMELTHWYHNKESISDPQPQLCQKKLLELPNPYPWAVLQNTWDLSWNTHHQYGSTVSDATSIKSNQFSGTLHILPVVITDGHLVWQPCCRSCSGIHSNNNELTAGSWCCTESELVSSPYLLQLTLNQLPSAPDICRFSAIHAHTVRHFVFFHA